MARKQQAKRVRKSFNATKQARRMTANLKTYTWQAQAAIEPPPYTRAKLKTNGSWLPVTSRQQAIFFRQSMDWIVGMRALCKSPDGVEYIESVTMTCRNYKLSELGDPRLNNWLLEFLLEDVKSSHVVDVGWLAHTFSGASWETDNERVGAWVCEGLGWLSIDSPWRRREWAAINDGRYEQDEEQVA